MADSKLSSLSSIAGSGLAGGDLFYVVDVSATTSGSKSITFTEMLTVFQPYSANLVTIASGVSGGALAVTTGGTGLTACTTGDLLIGTGANLLGRLAAGSSNNVLVVSGGLPAWTNALSVATVAASGQITSTVSTGTAPFVIASTTEVANLNAAKLQGNAASAFAAASHTHANTDITGFSSAALVASTSFALTSHTHGLSALTGDTFTAGQLIVGTGAGGLLSKLNAGTVGQLLIYTTGGTLIPSGTVAALKIKATSASGDRLAVVDTDTNSDADMFRVTEYDIKSWMPIVLDSSGYYTGAASIDVLLSNTDRTGVRVVSGGNDVGAQTGSPLLVVDGNGAGLLNVTHQGRVGIGAGTGANLTSALHITSGSATANGILVNGAASQSATLVNVKLGSAQTGSPLQICASSGTVLLSAGTGGTLALSPAVQTSGHSSSILLTAPAHTSVGASSELIDVDINTGRIVTWTGGGTVAQQRFVRIAQPIVTAGSATTFSSVVGGLATMVIDGAPSVGANITSTKPVAALIVCGGAGATNRSLVVVQGVTQGANIVEVVTAAGGVFWQIDSRGRHSSAVQANSATTTSWLFTVAADTSLTASTEKNNFYVQAASQQWATGALAYERFNRIGQPTAAFAGTSTLTTAGTFVVDGAPVPGTNATISTSAAVIANTGHSLGIALLASGAASQSQPLVVMQAGANQTGLIFDAKGSSGSSLLSLNNTGAFLIGGAAGAHGQVITASSSAGLAWTTQTRMMSLTCVDYTEDVTTGDGKGYMVVQAPYAGLNLTAVHAWVITAGTTGTTDIQIARIRSGTPVDMLSTKITIDSTENGSNTAATAAVINTSNDDLLANDLIRIDVDAASTTKPKGLIVTLNFA